MSSIKNFRLDPKTNLNRLEKTLLTQNTPYKSSRKNPAIFVMHYSFYSSWRRCCAAY